MPDTQLIKSESDFKENYVATTTSDTFSPEEKISKYFDADEENNNEQDVSVIKNLKYICLWIVSFYYLFCVSKKWVIYDNFVWASVNVYLNPRYMLSGLV